MANLDMAKYGELLLKYEPRVITSEEQYNLAINDINRLASLYERTDEESAILSLLCLVAEDYERLTEKSKPSEILKYLIESRGMTKSQLASGFRVIQSC